MEFYNLNMLRLTDKDLKSISAAVKEFLLSEADIVAASGAGEEEINKADKLKNIMPSLKYFFPAVPKPNEKPRPMSNDQKAQNVIFLREIKKIWKRAEDEMNTRVTEYVARGLKAAAENENNEFSSKAGNETARSTQSNNSASNNNNNNPNKRRLLLSKQLESQVLNELSLKQLRRWIEIDEDSKLQDENEKALEKLKEAKSMHEQFVKKKDR
jgi:hypothetical protein